MGSNSNWAPRTSRDAARAHHGSDVAWDSGLPIAVDLDGSVCVTDTLAESAVALVPRNPLHLLRSLAAVLDRARFKTLIADRFRPDPATLPYNRALIAYLVEQKRRGRRLILATAADQRIAEEVAGHLGIFDEAIGTRDGANLKGAAKRDLLVDRFGEKGFEYIGDSFADLPVWKAAAKGIAVSPSPRLTRLARRESIELLPMGAPPSAGWYRPVIRALRPHQWLKNVLIFLPILAAHKVGWAALELSLLAFIAFSMVASAAYLLNDLMDIENDRKHPSKRNRPLASGAMTAAAGLLWAGACFAGGFALAWFFLPAAAAIVIAGYFFATIAYSTFLKRLLIFDLVALSLLYATRVLAGAVSTATPLSDWMLLFCVFFFFGLSSVKRMTEIRALEDSPADGTLGRAYASEDLWVLTSLAVGSGLLSVLVFALYATSEEVILLYDSPRIALLTCPLLIYWTSRTALLAHRGELHDDPVVFAVRDPVSLATACAVLGVLVLAAVV